MQRVLFHSTIFGPIHSRRLGTSLGINLLPDDGKICSFDCLYCEAGYNAQGHGTTGVPSREDVARLLGEKLAAMKASGEHLVIDDTIALRNRYFPEVKISVLTNSTRLGSESVHRALSKVDNNILKLDSAIADTVQALDRPAPGYDLSAVIDRIASFGRQGIVQTMICRGEHDGKPLDNSTEAEIKALIEAYLRIMPGEIMLYTIDRPTPEVNLRRVTREELEAIAARITAATGIPVQVSA